MKLGDLLELIGIAGLAAAGYLVWGVPAGLGVAGLGVVYVAQCTGHIPVPNIMQVLGETRYRRVAALEQQLSAWPSVRPARGGGENALRAEVAWLSESIAFHRRLGLDPTALASELQAVRARIETNR